MLLRSAVLWVCLAAPALAQISPPCPGLVSGPVDSVAFDGLKTTRRPVVERELLNGAGRPFDCALWQKEKSRLEDLDIFAEVDLRLDTTEGKRVLVYSFRELPPYIPFISMSKTEQDGISAGPALASLNLFGWDIRTEAFARFGGTTEFQVSLSSPWLGPWPIEYDLAALRIDSYNHFEDFHEDSWRVKLDLAHRIWESPRDAAWNWAAGIAHILYATEVFHLAEAASGTPFLLEEQGDWVPRVGVGFLWDGRDRRHNPTRGWYQELRATRNGGPLGGPADYFEWLADTRLYLPWISRNTLLASGLYQYRTGEIGKDFGRYDLYHLGGVNTLRGYGNNAYRGKSEILLNVENRMDWIRKRSFKLWGWGGYYGLQGVLGWDGATAWDHDALLEGDLHHGIYIGTHLIIAGVDRIRLELAPKSAKFALAIDVGILEKADIQRFRSR